MDGGKGNQKNFTPLSKKNIKVHVALNRITGTKSISWSDKIQT